MVTHMINNSSSNVNVRNQSMDTIIGHLAPGEAYILVDGFYATSKQTIKFMNSAGNLVTGYLSSGNDLAAAGISVNDLAGFQRDFEFGVRVINSVECGTFLIMRDIGVFTTSGVWCGTFHFGDVVASASCVAGSTMPYLMAISCWYDDSEGIWKHENLMVDTGILEDSMNLAVRGQW